MRTPLLTCLLLAAVSLTSSCGDDESDAARADAAASDAAAAERDAGPHADHDGATGDAASADAATPAPLELDAYCDVVADWYYGYLQGCYGKDGYPDADADARKAEWRDRCLLARHGVDGARLVYDAVQAARCSAALQAAECYGDLEPPACQGVFVSDVELGADCYDDETRFFAIGATPCKDGLCVRAADACPGTCQAYPAAGAACLSGRCGPDHFCDPTDKCQPRRAEGETCDAADCVEGLACLQTSTAFTCLRPVPVGGACSADAPCAPPGNCISGECKRVGAAGDPCRVTFNCPDGLRCETAPGATEATCMAPGDVGAPCQTDNHCDEPRLYCDTTPPAAGSCKARPGAGQPCHPSAGCAPGTWCQHTTAAPDGECVDIGGLGDDCTQYGDVPDPTGCGADLFCITNGTCAPQAAAGDPCAVWVFESCVEGTYCTRETGTCIAPSAMDAQCNPIWPNTCADGLGCGCSRADYNACGSSDPFSDPTDTCQPLLSLGEPCKRAPECDSKRCEADDRGAYRCASDEPQPDCVGAN